MPFLPSSLPDFPGSKSEDKLSEKGQRIASNIEGAKTGKMLIQTGVASNPGERESMSATYDPGLFKNPKALYEQYNQLKDFYKTFLDIVDPQNVKGVRQESKKTFSHLWKK
jgi:hypothetical protein